MKQSDAAPTGGRSCPYPVGMGGFEPPTSASRTQRAAKLRHIPKELVILPWGARRPVWWLRSGPGKSSPCSHAVHERDAGLQHAFFSVHRGSRRLRRRRCHGTCQELSRRRKQPPWSDCTAKAGASSSFALALALVAGACGGDDDDSDAGSGSNGDEAVSGSVVVSGSSTVEPISAANAEKFSSLNPEVQISVDGPGTGDGFELFCQGETDVSDASRPIDPEEEIPACEENGIEYIELKVGIDGITRHHRVRRTIRSSASASRTSTPSSGRSPMASRTGPKPTSSARRSVAAATTPMPLSR